MFCVPEKEEAEATEEVEGELSEEEEGRCVRESVASGVQGQIINNKRDMKLL